MTSLSMRCEKVTGRAALTIRKLAVAASARNSLQRWPVKIIAMIAGVAVASGCTDTSDAPGEVDCGGIAYRPHVRTRQLAELPNVKADIELQMNNIDRDPIRARMRTLRAKVHFGEAISAFFLPLHDDDDDIDFCPELASTRGAVGGVDVPRTSSGGWVCRGVGGPLCLAPRFELELPADLHPSDAALALSDPSSTLTVPLGDALVERTATPVGISDWTFHANQALTFTWSPASDLAKLPDTLVALQAMVGDSFALTSGFIRGADTIGFTLPDYNNHGTFGIRLRGLVQQPSFQISISQVVVHDATIVP